MHLSILSQRGTLDIYGTFDFDCLLHPSKKIDKESLLRIEKFLKLFLQPIDIITCTHLWGHLEHVEIVTFREEHRFWRKALVFNK